MKTKIMTLMLLVVGLFSAHSQQLQNICAHAPAVKDLSRGGPDHSGATCEA